MMDTHNGKTSIEQLLSLGRHLKFLIPFFSERLRPLSNIVGVSTFCIERFGTLKANDDGQSSINCTISAILTSSQHQVSSTVQHIQIPLTMGVKQSLVNTPHNQSSINTVLSFLVKFFARQNNHTKGKSEVAVHSFVEVIYQVRNVIAVITPCPVRLLDVLSLRLFLMQHTRTLLQCYQTNLRYRQCLDIEHR